MAVVSFMKTKLLVCLSIVVALGIESNAQLSTSQPHASLLLNSSKLKPSPARSLRIDQLFYETANGRITLTNQLSGPKQGISSQPWSRTDEMADGRKVTIAVRPLGNDFNLMLKAQPDSDITRWGLSLQSTAGEYYTGLMERVIDGPQAKSWAPGITEAMDLRGQRVDMIIKPTTSIYAPFFLSSRRYAVLVKSNWPGVFDFAVEDPQRVRIGLIDRGALENPGDTTTSRSTRRDYPNSRRW